jgi:hypothetical protein
MKRVEQERFQWPDDGGAVVEMSEQALSWLLSGLDVRQAHQRLAYTSVS